MFVRNACILDSILQVAQAVAEIQQKEVSRRWTNSSIRTSIQKTSPTTAKDAQDDITGNPIAQVQVLVLL